MANLLASSFNSLPIPVGYWETVEALGLGEIGPFKQRAGRIAFLWRGVMFGDLTLRYIFKLCWPIKRTAWLPPSKGESGTRQGNTLMKDSNNIAGQALD